MKTLFAMIALIGVTGCASVVRDRATYSTEVAWHELMHKRSSRMLLKLATTSTACPMMAEHALTLQRHGPWRAHVERALAGVADGPLPPEPPIPTDDDVVMVCGGGSR